MYTFLNFWKGNLSLWKHKHNKTDRKKITICNMFMEKIGWKVMIILEKKRIVAINCKINECTIFRFSKQYLLKIQQPLFSGENSKLKCTMKQSLWMPHKLNPTSLLTNIWECPDQWGWTARKMFYGTGSRVRTEVDKQTDTLVNMKYTGC